jgi:hypothetical protein
MVDPHQRHSTSPNSGRNLVVLFRSLVAASTLLFLLAALSPLVNWSVIWPETQHVLGYDRDMAVLSLPVPVSELFVFISVLVAVGLWQFKSWARFVLLAIILASAFLTGLGGVAVRLPFEAVLEYAVALMDGAILTMAYFSPLNSKFSKDT